MTRPKADSDGWLTDPISRDRTIAKTVVHGMAEILTLLRGIRSDLDESRALRTLIRELEQENLSLRVELAGDYHPSAQPHLGYTMCLTNLCILPIGHHGNHQPTRKSG